VRRVLVASVRDRCIDRRWIVGHSLRLPALWQHLLYELFIAHDPDSNASDLIGRPLFRRAGRDVYMGAGPRRPFRFVEDGLLSRPERSDLGLPVEIRLQNA
jgi:hypothetical protein